MAHNYVIMRLLKCLLCSSTVRKSRLYSTTIVRRQADITPDIFYDIATTNYAVKQASFSQEGKCTQCFLPKLFCVCSRLREVFSSSNAKPKARMSLFMHYKEWGRISNTGKIISTGLPDQTNMYIYGIKEDHNKLKDSLKNIPSLILYPSKTSQPISNYKDWYNDQPEVNLCVLDSTWSQSHSLDRAIPANIPRVHIDDLVKGSSQFLNRKQSNVPGRVSTLESIALALEGLGETETVLNPMYQALYLSVDSVLCLQGKKTVYGHNFVSQIAKASSIEGTTGVFSERSVARPSHCPHCLLTSDQIIFRNLGIRKDPNMLIEETTCLYRKWQCQNCIQHFYIPVE